MDTSFNRTFEGRVEISESTYRSLLEDKIRAEFINQINALKNQIEQLKTELAECQPYRDYVISDEIIYSYFKLRQGEFVPNPLPETDYNWVDEPVVGNPNEVIEEPITVNTDVTDQPIIEDLEEETEDGSSGES